MGKRGHGAGGGRRGGTLQWVTHTHTAAYNCVFTIISVPEAGVSNGDSRDSSVVRALDL